MSEKALEKQIGGNHYKNLAIQPAVYCQRNRLPYCESSVVQYVTRHREKNGREDIEKAIHCLELLLDLDYGGRGSAQSEPPTPKEEVVLCIPRKAFNSMPQGIVIGPEAQDMLNGISVESNFAYIPRDAAEDDANFKQLIPYILVMCGDKILTYQRGKRGGEARLHRQFSIGIGGHVHERGENAYRDGALRELAEEIEGYAGQVEAPGLLPPMVAVINDDSNPVGSVHLGIVHVLFVQSEEVAAKCTSIVDPHFALVGDVRGNAQAYEPWSRLCLAHIDALVRTARSR